MNNSIPCCLCGSPITTILCQCPASRGGPAVRIKGPLFKPLTHKQKQQKRSNRMTAQRRRARR